VTTGSRLLSVRGAFALFAFSVLGVLVLPADGAPKVLFSSPLHVTREVTSPVSKAKSVVDEYCNGNRVVSVSGSRTAIVDYDKGEMTAIDFAASTYSVTKFETIAKAHEGMRTAALAGEARDWSVEPRGGSVVASRPGQTVEAERKADHLRQNIRVTADSQLTLSRGAVEALLGLSYPNAPDASAEVVLGALRAERPRLAETSASVSSASAESEYRLPLEYVVRFDIDGETIESRSVVLRVGSELAPPDVLAIPPGAKLVDSDIVAARKQLDDLEHPPTSSHR
jgi:hypothetical protein